MVTTRRPAGLDQCSFESTVFFGYLDLTGSGLETIAHLKENSRIVLMFCALEGPPKIVRLHGQGEPIEPKHPDFETLRVLFTQHEKLSAWVTPSKTCALKASRIRRGECNLGEGARPRAPRERI
jgi:hypothetical protein